MDRAVTNQALADDFVDLLAQRVARRHQTGIRPFLRGEVQPPRGCRASAKQCVLVIIGADAMGNKDIVGMVDGYRESAQSWKELLLDLKRRGLETGPELAVGDGALGFWKALREVYGETRVQRCWVHKTANVLNQMPKSLQAKAKGHLHDIWMAETRADAEAAFDFFIAAYGAKYHKAAERLVKDRERLLSFYDFPAEHWKHIRTTNPIESTFATVADDFVDLLAQRVARRHQTGIRPFLRGEVQPPRGCRASARPRCRPASRTLV